MPAAAAPDPCGVDGPAPTVLGTTRGEVLRGTPGDDVIHGLGGHDTIVTSNGNDTICGGPGNDTVSYRSLRTPVNIDLQSGQASRFGGTDVLASIERVHGGSNDDVIAGTDLPNNLLGGGGNDIISGRGGDDVIWGEAGNDKQLGGNGNDILAGGLGVDIANGEDGNDRLFFDGDSGSVHGGPGNDTLSSSLPDIHVDLTNRTAGSATAPTAYALASIENVDLGSSPGPARVVGDAGPNRIWSARGGAQHMIGKAGDDFIVVIYPASPSIVEGGAGADSIWLENVPLAPDERNVIYGGPGEDQVFGSPGDDTIYGDGDGDALNGRDGDDTLYGGPGTDVCDGEGHRTRDIARSCETTINVP
jgi:Ca2+-binding RTX toxin-like protein